MKTIDMTNGLTINAQLFIIPNHACHISGLFDFAQADHLARMKKICELNGLEFDPEKDWLVECWYLSEELGCENIPNHNIRVLNENGKRCTIGVENRYLPSNIFKGKKEGETISVKLPVWMRVEGEDKEFPNGKDIVADFTISLDQTKYRYRRFGNFEDVLSRVTDYNL